MILRVVTNHFVASVLLSDNGIVWEAAPILEDMLGWRAYRAHDHCGGNSPRYEEKWWRCSVMDASAHRYVRASRAAIGLISYYRCRGQNGKKRKREARAGIAA